MRLVIITMMLLRYGRSFYNRNAYRNFITITNPKEFGRNNLEAKIEKKKMKALGLGAIPNDIRNQLNTAARLKNYNLMKTTWEDMKSNKDFVPSHYRSDIYGRILSVCSEKEHAPLAEEILGIMMKAGMKIKERHTCTQIRCLAANDDNDEALKLIQSIETKDLRQRTFLPVLQSYARTGQIDQMLTLLHDIEMKYKLEISSELVSVALACVGYAKSKGFEVTSDSMNKIDRYIHEANKNYWGFSRQQRDTVLAAHGFTVGVGEPEIPVLIEHEDVLGEIVGKDNDLIYTRRFDYDKDDCAGTHNRSYPQENNISLSDGAEEVTYKRVPINSFPKDSVNIVSLRGDNTTCPNCGGHLGRTNLTDEDRVLIKSGIKDYIERATRAQKYRKNPPNPERMDQMVANKLAAHEEFAEFLDKSPIRYNYIIDGPNVAYLHQNYVNGSFHYSQIQAVVDKLEAEVGREAGILVVLPYVYTKPRVPNQVKHLLTKGQKRYSAWSQLSAHDMEILTNLRRRRQIYIVPPGNNDDWYWIYSAVARNDSNTFVVTNDKMRDHRFEFIDKKLLWRFVGTQVVRFDLNAYRPGRAYKSPEIIKAAGGIERYREQQRNNTSSNTTHWEDDWDGDVSLYYPSEVSREFQRSDTHWHIPLHGLNAERDSSHRDWLQTILSWGGKYLDKSTANFNIIDPSPDGIAAEDDRWVCFNMHMHMDQEQ